MKRVEIHLTNEAYEALEQCAKDDGFSAEPFEDFVRLIRLQMNSGGLKIFLMDATESPQGLGLGYSRC